MPLCRPEIKVGPNSIVAVGQRVAVENHFYCEDCVLCEENRGDICMKMSQYGHGKGTTQGGCSQLSNISSKYLYPINSDITDEQACLIEPMGKFNLSQLVTRNPRRCAQYNRTY